MEIVPPVLLPEGADEEDNELEDFSSLGSPGPGDGIEWILLPGANGEVHVAVLSPPPLPMGHAMRMMRPTDVEFFLYTRCKNNAPRH